MLSRWVIEAIVERMIADVTRVHSMIEQAYIKYSHYDFSLNETDVLTDVLASELSRIYTKLLDSVRVTEMFDGDMERWPPVFE